jgi:hypothetical protein
VARYAVHGKHAKSSDFCNKKLIVKNLSPVLRVGKKKPKGKKGKTKVANLIVEAEGAL